MNQQKIVITIQYSGSDGSFSSEESDFSYEIEGDYIFDEDGDDDVPSCTPEWAAAISDLRMISEHLTQTYAITDEMLKQHGLFYIQQKEYSEIYEYAVENGIENLQPPSSFRFFADYDELSSLQFLSLKD